MKVTNLEIQHRARNDLSRPHGVVLYTTAQYEIDGVRMIAKFKDVISGEQVLREITKIPVVNAPMQLTSEGE